MQETRSAYYKMRTKPRKQFFRSLLNFMYLGPYSLLKKKPKLKDIPQTNITKTKVAFICDEMTWVDYSGYVSSIFLHPRVWEKQMEEFSPDILFCESAWCGIDKYYGTWRGRIYKDKRLVFENRKVLLDILKYCKGKKIPTVFWNKEDPLCFNHKIYDFTDTALLFDYIFTTAKECINGYKALGHKKVELLPFGINTAMFNSKNRQFIPSTVVFAGSWFSDQTERCRDLETILDYVIANGWKLDIYDRKSECKGNRFRFPTKYKQYLRKAVPYSDIPELCKKYEYAINVNTITESETMFSRRLLQMAACGIKIISNKSVAFLNHSPYLISSSIDNGIFSLEYDIEKISADYSTEKQFRKVLTIVLS